MSTLPVLVSALATVDGRDRATLQYYARAIRQAGYIATGKRGMGASKITCPEAVNLLIALNGCDGASDAPSAIERFRSLKHRQSGTTRQLREWAESYDAQLPPIKAVMDVHTFGEALDALLEGTPDLVAGFLDFFKQKYPNFPSSGFLPALALPLLGIDILFGRYHGQIEIFHMSSGVRVVDFNAKYFVDEEKADKGFYGSGHADRKVSVSIGLRTLMAAWQGLHPMQADIGAGVEDL